MPVNGERADGGKPTQEGVQFTMDSAQRIADVVRYVEGRPRNLIDPYEDGTRFPTFSILMAQTGSGGIPAMGGTTPGSAEVTLCEVTFDSGGNPTHGTVPSGQTLTVYNIFSAPVGANKRVYIAFTGGVWGVTAEDCTV